MKDPVKHQSLVLLAHGQPVPLVAEKIGRSERTVYRWLKRPYFSEALRAETARAMAGSRRALGSLARRSVGSAGKALERLERTIDDEKETAAARDRAAHRLLVHAFKWGQVFDKGLESREASGAYSREERNNLYNQIKKLENESAWNRNEVGRVLAIIDDIEDFLKKSGIELPDELKERLKPYEQAIRRSKAAKKKMKNTDIY